MNGQTTPRLDSRERRRVRDLGERPRVAAEAKGPALLSAFLLTIAACAEPPRSAPSAAGVTDSVDVRAQADDIGGGDTGGRDSVVAELTRYYGSFSARDWTAFADHFWPGATLTTVWQPPGAPAPQLETITVPVFVERAPAGPGSKPIFEEKMDSVRVRLLGNLAQAWAFYTAKFGDSTSVATWRGVDAFTVMSHEGRWRIASVAFATLSSDTAR